MFKRIMVLITLGATLAAFAVWNWNFSVVIPGVGIFAAAQLIGAAMIFIIATLTVTIFADLISWGI